MSCPICQGGLYGHEDWCAVNKFEAERIAFEQWASANVGTPKFEGRIMGSVWSYDTAFIELAWKCWRAARNELSLPLPTRPPNRIEFIIGALDKFAKNGLPINAEQGKPATFKTIPECEAHYKAYLSIADDTVRRLADRALASVPESIRI